MAGQCNADCACLCYGSAVYTAKDFLDMNRRDLAHALVSGHPIDPAALDDTQYRGISLGLPRFIERLSWKTFRKVFHRDPATGSLRGWNVRLQQHGLDAPSVPMLRRGRPFTFGHFQVISPEGRPMPLGDYRGLLIDYGLAPHAPFDVTRFLRDPIVALNPGSVDLLLGFSYLEIGPWRFATRSFFTLELEGPLEGPPPA